MKTTNLTAQSANLRQILSITASAFGIKLPDCTRIDPRILASEFKDPNKFSI